MYAVRARRARAVARGFEASRSVAARRLRQAQWSGTPFNVVGNSTSPEHHAQTIMPHNRQDDGGT